MSVGVYMETEDQKMFELEFFIPIAVESFFVKYWQKGIDELRIRTIQNGIELRKEGLSLALDELQQLEVWAKKNPELEGKEYEYMSSRIERLKKELPKAFEDNENAVLWIG